MRGVFGIEFRQNKFRRKLCRSLSKGGCHHAAGATPGSPEIDEYWHLGSTCELEKVLLGEFYRMYRQQWSFALSAQWVVVLLRVRDPIYRRALRAD
jgi:hypothetical protein